MSPTTRGIDRRAFLKMVGGGIVVLVTARPAALLSQDRRRPIYPDDLNAYLRIGEDGRVTIFSGKIEMGQGVMTSQAQMAAEELGVALDAIEMVLGDTDRCPWDMGTFGSLTTRMFGPALRAAAAEARAVLVRLAAKELGVAKERLVVADGVVSVAGEPDRRVTFGELARGKAISRLVDEEAVLRSVADFQVMGRSPERMDSPAKVTGAAEYAADVRLPGMLYASVLRPPSHGATLGAVDPSPAAAVPGATVVRLDDLVAVLHADPETAERALRAVRAEWREPAPPFDDETVFDHLLGSAPEPEVKDDRGDRRAAREAASRVFETAYRKGYVAHAPMEPHAALARVEDGKATVWASTQTPFPTRDRIAEALGFRPEKVRVVTPYLGGGFGGKSAGRQAIEAARLAQAAGRPVQVAWSRAEEFFYDTFDPACLVKLASAVDSDGRITLWDYEVYFAGDRGADLYYDVPNARVRVFGSWRGAGSEAHLFGVGPWRAPGANMNAFAIESQVDSMAAAAGLDPLDFRLRNLSDPRMRRVLETVAETFGWQAAAAPGGRSGRGTGRGRGVACAIDAGTYVALMAEVAVDAERGAVRVERIACAQDMGIVVSPEGATLQMEGCLTMGLGYVLSEELRFRGGKILDKNFGTYDLARFSWLPEIRTVLVENHELAPQGGGEPAIVPLGAVVANAVFDATGARLHRLPMTPERVREAIGAVAG
ncbi:MAG TPA: molybdopterin cofactor-binding domain-containing protein [Thermoanaerobaculia bacterium]|nr:molybdopterin cofactor-binding domain-containing protein [Thermoanaerobaculia bacterium]